MHYIYKPKKLTKSAIRPTPINIANFQIKTKYTLSVNIMSNIFFKKIKKNFNPNKKVGIGGF